MLYIDFSNIVRTIYIRQTTAEKIQVIEISRGHPQVDAQATGFFCRAFCILTLVYKPLHIQSRQGR